MIAFRHLLAAAAPPNDSSTINDLHQYPHNSYIEACIPFVPISSLASMSVAELALVFRRATLEGRTLPTFVSTAEYYATSGGAFPLQASGADLYATSCHLDAKVNDILFGADTPVISCWCWLPPILPPGAFGVSLFSATLRTACRTEDDTM